MLRKIKSTGLVLIVLVLALVLSLRVTGVLALTPTPCATTPLTRTTTPMACSTMPPTYYLTVAPLDINGNPLGTTTVNVGDQIIVRETTNVGIGRFSLSVIDNATGLVQSETDPIFTPAAPLAQTPTSGTLVASWTLTAVRSGSVTFKGSVSGEVLVCSGGSLVYTWGNASGQSGTVTVGGAVSTLTPTPTPTVNGNLPDLTVVSITEYTWVNPTATTGPSGCTGRYTGGRGVVITFKNIGTADAGTFVVSMNGSEQTVSGLAAGQTSSVKYASNPTSRTATVDATNLITESDESNNTLMNSVTPGPSVTWTVPPTICRTPTPTRGITNTPTATPTITRTITLTLSPTISRTPTRTLTPVVGACSPLTSIITAPFTFDGVGTYCWQSSNLGTYINSWNTTSVNINGVNITNLYVPVASYPAKIGGYWYVGYSSSVAWGHFEAK